MKIARLASLAVFLPLTLPAQQVAPEPLFELRAQLSAADLPELHAWMVEAITEDGTVDSVADEVGIVVTGFAGEDDEPAFVARAEGVDLGEDWIEEAETEGAEILEIDGQTVVHFESEGDLKGESYGSRVDADEIRLASSEELFAVLPDLVGSGESVLAEDAGGIAAWADLEGIRALGAGAEELAFADSITGSFGSDADGGAELTFVCQVNDDDGAAMAEGTLRNYLQLATMMGSQDPELAELVGLIGGLEIEREPGTMTVSMVWTPEQIEKIQKFVEENREMVPTTVEF